MERCLQIRWFDSRTSFLSILEPPFLVVQGVPSFYAWLFLSCSCPPPPLFFSRVSRRDLTLPRKHSFKKIGITRRNALVSILLVLCPRYPSECLRSRRAMDVELTGYTAGAASRARRSAPGERHGIESDRLKPPAASSFSSRAVKPLTTR